MAFWVRSLLLSGKEPLVMVTRKGPVATMTMQRHPVNSFNTPMFLTMTEELRRIEADPTVGAVVLASANRHMFSAGLDLTEMYKYESVADLQKFWRAFQDWWLAFYMTPLWTIAAIGGHATAAGCGLALCCDYRIGADGPFSIGLNESQFGLIPPRWFLAPMQHTVGQRHADRMLKRGAVLRFDEAKKVGLLDEVVPQEILLARAQAEALKWVSPVASVAAARSEVKRMLRQADADVLLKDREADEQWFLDRMTRPGFERITTESKQRDLEMYLKALAAKKAAL
eukprot:EG_transcript_14338